MFLGSAQATLPPQDPEVPEGYASQEFGEQETDGPTYSELQQQADQQQLEESLKTEVYEQPNAANIAQGVPAIVQSLKPFDLQPIITVSSTKVGIQFTVITCVVLFQLDLLDSADIR